MMTIKALAGGVWRVAGSVAPVLPFDSSLIFRRTGSVRSARRMASAAAFAALAGAVLVLAHGAACAAPIDREAHVKLTDGIRASAGAEDPAYVTFYGDATQLPRRHYNLGDYCFWGSGYKSIDLHDEKLKEAAILGVGIEIAWSAMQGDRPVSDLAPTDLTRYGVEDRVNDYFGDGCTISAQVGYTPGWANGLMGKNYPPNVAVEQEVLVMAGGNSVVNLAHSPVVVNIPLWFPFIVTPSPVPKTRIEDEVITTNFQPDPDLQVDKLGRVLIRTSRKPIIVGTEKVWVDEGNGWVLWNRVDNIFDAPIGAAVYQVNRLGVVRFKPTNIEHGRTPATGSKVKISYDAIDVQYTAGADYLFDNLTGTLTRRVGDISGFIASETFDSTTLDSRWQWMNPPASCDVNTTLAGHLHYTVNSTPPDGVGHFIHQNFSGAGDFRMSAKITNAAYWELGVQKPLTQTGLMVYQDAQNWFRYGLTTDQGRPYLTRCVNGVTTTTGGGGEYGWQVKAPRYITVMKYGNTYTAYTHYRPGATGPDGDYQFICTFDQTLTYPLKVGVSSTGLDTAGVDVDEVTVEVPRIPANGKVAVFYNYLNPDPWLRYVRETVGYFKDRIKYWQSWNEPDLWMCWAGGQDLHAVMQGLFAQAVREADPEAQVIGGGYANGSNHQIETVYKIAGANSFDYASWHPYLFSNKAPDAIGWETVAHQRARDIMATYGDADKEVFFGEISAGSGVLQSGGGLNDRKQADYGSRLLLLSRKLGWVKSVQWWPGEGDLADVGLVEDNEHGYHGGLFYRITGRQRDISKLARVNGRVSIEVAHHIDLTYRVGDRIVVSGVTEPDVWFNGTFTVEALESVYNPLFGTSKLIRIITSQSGKPDGSAVAPYEGKLGIVRPYVEPKPIFYAFRNLASNRGILMDLCSYDADSQIIPAEGTYPVSSVRLGVRDRSEIAEVTVLTSRTCTDDSSRPARVAAGYQGYAGQRAAAVQLNTSAPGFCNEKWSMLALSCSYFGVQGSVSGFQGIAVAGLPFQSLNGVVKSVTIPLSWPPYAPGEEFTFETFAGDGWRQAATWTPQETLSGPGTISVDLPSPVNARYVEVRIRRAGGADSAGIDEVEVLDTTGANVAEGKLYTVDGYQDWFATPEASQYELGEARHLPDNTNVQLPPAVLYLKGQGYGYLETADRAVGLRFEGVVDAQPGDLVTVTGSMGTTPGGEKYVQVRSMTVVGTGQIGSLGMNGGNLLEPMADALLVRVWGRLVPGSVTDNSFRITTFNGEVEVRTNTRASLPEGEIITVTGAAGYDNGRVLYAQ